MAGLSSIPLRPDRAQDLDLLKTLLVIGMVGAHVVQLITFRPRPEAVAWADYANIVSFSGFMLAFGIGLGLPKPEGRQRSLWSRLRPVLLLLLAVYASSFGFVFLVDKRPPTVGLIVDVVSMRRLFGWSEFLATFFVLSVIQLVARPLLLAIGRNPYLLVLASAAGLASTYLKTDAIVPLLPTLVGHTGMANFPLLVYLPWFLVGIWYGSHRVRWWHFGLALVATGCFVWQSYRLGMYPERFPPSILWVIGAAAPMLAYVAVSRWLAARVRIPDVLLTPGRHVLSFLVLSNLALFATRYVAGRPPLRTTLADAGVTGGILAALTLGWWLWERARLGSPRS